MTDTIPPDYELLVGSQAFWQRAQADIAAAHRRVLIQAMTFEGDSAGQAVAAAIAASGAADRRVLVDDYTRHVINDTFLSRSRDEALHAEAQATWAMFDRLADAGVGLRITNPVGRNPLRYALRNHKKLLVMDDAVWLGGINFSEHNFAWHDMMLRIAHPGLAGWLAAAFERDWQGECGAARAAFPGIEMLSVDGSGNAAHLAPLLDLFAGARRRIEVISAYPTFPFVSAMASAARRGVPVTLYTPRPNNKPIIRDYLLGVAAGSGLEIRLLPEMTHVKAALVDGEVLVAGSSNFDFVSHRASAEYVVTLRDAGVIARCEAELFAPLRAAAVAPGPGDHSPWRSWRARAALRTADVLIGLLEPGARIAPWNQDALARR